MIFSPIPGTPLITQGFGQNPDIYSQFGYLGHNGIDFGIPEGTIVYAPHDGVATVRDEGVSGYGISVTIEDSKRRSLLAHLSQATVANGQPIYQGDPIGLSGKTGMATGPHLHWTFKILKDGIVQNRDNGYDGAIDVTEFTRLWQDQDLHFDAQYTDDAKAYLAMTFSDQQYLKNPARRTA
ncbi:MAG: M23 family metallopeptidase [Candidatus Peribacteraceae bacterium]|nr:M23 family metallopeptidase [Candidatus Peribacteraceae bacterium]